MSMCELKTQHNKSYWASRTFQLIGCPPPTSLFANSPEGLSRWLAALFNIELCGIISARGVVGLKVPEHCLLCSLGYLRHMERGKLQELAFNRSVCFLGGLAPTSEPGHPWGTCVSSQARLPASVCAKGKGFAGLQMD